MTAQEKIAGATRFLKILKVTPIEDIPRMQDMLSAFLSDARSVLDHMLYDYSEVFSLGFTTNDIIDKDGKKFERRARDLGKVEAIHFIKWWRQEKKKISQDPIGGPLTNTRNIDVHRKLVPVKFTVKISNRGKVRTKLSTKLHVGYTDEKGRKRTYERPVVPEVIVPAGMKVSVDLFFQDIADIDAITACERFLGLITSVVKEAKRIF